MPYLSVSSVQNGSIKIPLLIFEYHTIKQSADKSTVRFKEWYQFHNSIQDFIILAQMCVSPIYEMVAVVI